MDKNEINRYRLVHDSNHQKKEKNICRRFNLFQQFHSSAFQFPLSVMVGILDYRE